jgi:hypothetical protein
MSEPFKLPTDEYTLLVGLQQKLTQLIKQLGELHYQKKSVEIALQKIDSSFVQLDSEAADAIKTLQDKYGSGQVNLADGTFIPDSTT